jgi:hypothetical protein
LRIGDRVILWEAPDQYTDLVAGDCGTIYSIDWPKEYAPFFDARNSLDTSTVVWVRWDRGAQLGLVAELDNFTVIRDDEVAWCRVPTR